MEEMSTVTGHYYYCVQIMNGKDMRVSNKEDYKNWLWSILVTERILGFQIKIWMRFTSAFTWKKACINNLVSTCLIFPTIRYISHIIWLLTRWRLDRDLLEVRSFILLRLEAININIIWLECIKGLVKNKTNNLKMVVVLFWIITFRQNLINYFNFSQKVQEMLNVKSSNWKYFKVLLIRLINNWNNIIKILTNHASLS